MTTVKTMKGKKAVAYYRSAVYDNKAIEKKRRQAQKYAKKQGLKIIHEEIDNGISGLSTLEKRPGLKRLFKIWIENPYAPTFDFVVLADESRLGRLQISGKSDYEKQCNKNGKELIYYSKHAKISP